MGERTNSHGNKSFEYSNDDLQRIRSEDTNSTKEFKDSYKKWAGSNHHSNHRSHSRHHHSHHYSNHTQNRHVDYERKPIRVSPPNFGRWNNIIYSFVISMVIAFIAFYTNNGFLKFLNVISWGVFSFFLYRNIFYYVNSIDLSDDLKYIGVRIVGAIISIIGFIVGGMFFFGGLVLNADPVSMGVGVVVLGIAVLGAFMTFRTNRRYGHIYVNR